MSNINQTPVAVAPAPGFAWWNEGIRGVPNTFIRSALFGISKKEKEPEKNEGKENEAIKNEYKLIASAKGFTINFKGTPLNQDDLIVWSEIIHNSRFEAEPDLMKLNCCDIKLAELLKNSGKTYGGKEIAWLKKSIKDLNEAFVKVEFDRQRVGYEGKLLEQVVLNGNEYKIFVNPNLAYLFEDGSKRDFTRINFERKIKEAKNGLLGWLFNFYSSHENKGYPAFSVETIHKLCGSKDTKIFSFKRQLKTALYHLENATNWKCEIEDNKVYVIDTSILSTEEMNEYKARRFNKMMKDEDFRNLVEAEKKIMEEDPDYIPF